LDDPLKHVFGLPWLLAQAVGDQAPYLSPLAIAELVIAIACVVGIFLLSLSESALVRVTETKLRVLAEEGDRRAERVQRLKAGGPDYLSATIIATDACVLGASAAATDFSRRIWPNDNIVHELVAAGMVLFIVMFCEITPKTYGMRRAAQTALKVGDAVAILTVVLRPVIRLVTALGNVLVRVVIGNAARQRPLITDNGIRILVGIAEEEGEVEPQERAMIEGIMELHTTTAREVMVPRTNVVAVSSTASMNDVLETITAHGYSRIPVYGEGLDDILGILYVNDLMAHLRAGISGVDLRTIIRPVLNVPETKRIDELFEEMRSSKQHMAIVIDEYGGTAGIVTIEDILEEIVGEITDEHDQAEPMIIRQPDGSLIVDARLPVEDLAEELDVQIPNGDYDTVGGFVYDIIGDVPAEGATIKWANVTMTVLQADAQHVSKLQIRVEPSEEGET